MSAAATAAWRAARFRSPSRRWATRILPSQNQPPIPIARVSDRADQQRQRHAPGRRDRRPSAGRRPAPTPRRSSCRRSSPGRGADRGRRAGSSCSRVTAIAIPPAPAMAIASERQRERRREGEHDRAETERDRADGDRARTGSALEGDPQGGQRRADAGRRHQEPEPGRADVQDVVGQRRDEDREVHPERRREADDRDGEQHDRRRPDVARALGQGRDDLGPVPRARVLRRSPEARCRAWPGSR